MRSKITFLVLAVVALLAQSCHKHEQATVHKPYRVEVMPVDSTDISSQRTYSGTVEAANGSVISFPVAGTLQSIRVDEGDRVVKGQLIATVNPATLKNAHEIALATLNEAQDTYNRMKKLHDSRSLSDMQFVEVENALKSAQSAEAIARRSLGDANLYAPFSGYIAEKYVDAGSNVAPGIPVVKVVTINPVKVSISIPENEIAGIVTGQSAVVTGESLPQSKYDGVVVERGVTADPITRAYTVNVQLPNADEKLLPGMICDVQLIGEKARNVIIVPNSAVLLDARNNNYVWVAKDGRSYKRPVIIEGLADNGIIISSGLEHGDTVIVKGQQKVSQNSLVDIINK